MEKLTKVKFIKSIELSGEIWYKIFSDVVCLKASQDMNEAKAFYDNLVIALEKGYPVSEVLAEREIRTKD